MTQHLVAFEYGSGAVWGFVSAESAEEVTATVPWLEIGMEAPAWMGEDELALLASQAVELDATGTVDSLIDRHRMCQLAGLR